jgi:hypothetical protein
MKSSALIGIALSLVALTACGGSDSDPTNNPNEAGSGSSEAGCQKAGFAEGTSTQGLLFRGGWAFEAATSDEREFMTVQGFPDSQGPSAAGTYTLTGENYKDCGLCLLAGTGCNDGACERYFYAHEGTIELSSVAAESGETLAGTLNDVVFEEVVIDRNNTSTKVPNGSQWCFNDYTFSVTMTGDSKDPQEVRSFGAAEQSCVASGNGIGIGNNIANLQLPNCNGDTVSLHNGCGAQKAVWFVHTAGWCSSCSDWIAQVNQLDQQEEADGIEVYYILGQTLSYEIPTSDYCTQYARQTGVDPARVLIDNNSENVPWRTFGQSINTYEMEGIPWNAILRGSNMEYIWADNANDGTITTLQESLDALLEKDVDNVPTW